MTDSIADSAALVHECDGYEQRVDQLVNGVLAGADTEALERELGISAAAVRQAMQPPSAAELERARFALRAALSPRASDREEHMSSWSFSARDAEQHLGGLASEDDPVEPIVPPRAFMNRWRRSVERAFASTITVAVWATRSGARTLDGHRGRALPAAGWCVAVGVSVAVVATSSMLLHGADAEKSARGLSRPPMLDPAIASAPLVGAAAERTDRIRVTATAPGASVQPRAVWVQGVESYALQVASFRDKAEADTYVDQLQARGHDAYEVTAQIPERGVFHRVRIGPFETRAAALAYQAEFEGREGTATVLVEPRAAERRLQSRGSIAGAAPTR